MLFSPMSTHHINVMFSILFSKAYIHQRKLRRNALKKALNLQYYHLKNSGLRMSCKDVLNKIKWTSDLTKTEVWYVHRGAINDTKIISGKEILALENSFMRVEKASIPYHRIFKIFYDGKLIWERKKR